jgi:hypothetical protein
MSLLVTTFEFFLLEIAKQVITPHHLIEIFNPMRIKGIFTKLTH